MSESYEVACSACGRCHVTVTACPTYPPINILYPCPAQKEMHVSELGRAGVTLCEKWIMERGVENSALRAENARLRGLVAGAFEVVELWGHATIHNGQTEWAKGWLANARAALSSQAPEVKGAPHSKSEQRRVTIQQETKGESGEVKINDEIKVMVEKVFDGIALRVDQYFKRKNIQGGVRCGDDLFSPMDKHELAKSIALLVSKPAEEQKP